MNLFPAGVEASFSCIGEYLPAGKSANTKAVHLLPATTLSVAAVFIADTFSVFNNAKIIFLQHFPNFCM